LGSHSGHQQRRLGREGSRRNIAKLPELLRKQKAPATVGAGA